MSTLSNSKLKLILIIIGIAGIAWISTAVPKRNQTSSTKQEEKAVPKTESTRVMSPQNENELAGEIFGVQVPMGNYLFVKRVHSIFKDDETKSMTPEQMEDFIFQNLIYSYEANLRKIEMTDTEMDQWIDSVLQALDVKIDRKKDPEAYKKWAADNLKEEIQLFENQMKYMAQVEKLKREMVKEMKVEVNDQEILEDYLNVQNHVGGEYTIFETKKEADEFYEKYKDQKDWEAMKKEKPDLIKPFSLITVQAIIDLWGVPKAQINEFHDLEIGTVGKPLPFGKKWGVFRLLDKRTGKASDLPEKRDEYRKRVESRKQYEARDKWLKDIVKEANLKVYVKP